MCICSLFFLLPLILTLVAASISHFPTAAITFLLFFQQNSSPLFFISHSKKSRRLCDLYRYSHDFECNLG